MKWIIVPILVVLLLILVVSNIVIVQQSRAYVVERLGALLGSPVTTAPRARFAGAIGAAIRAQALA